jgi:hypothetical protein
LEKKVQNFLERSQLRVKLIRIKKPYLTWRRIGCLGGQVLPYLSAAKNVIFARYEYKQAFLQAPYRSI